MKRLPILAASLVLATGALAACGGDDDDDKDQGGGTTTPAQTGAQATTQAAGAAGGEVAVSIKNTAFEPKNVTAKVGQTIKWTNDDPVAHTVTARSGEEFDSGTVDAGGEYEYKVRKAGTIDYVCTIHPNQKGQIVAK